MTGKLRDMETSENGQSSVFSPQLENLGMCWRLKTDD
jgi:hypothetical protein